MRCTDTVVRYGSATNHAVNFLQNETLAMAIDTSLVVSLEATLKLKERAAAVGDTAVYGQVWVKNTDPNELWFTDGDGADHQVAFV